MILSVVILLFVAQVAFVGWAMYRLGRAQVRPATGQPRGVDGQYVGRHDAAYRQVHADLRAVAARTRA